jgi:hypothetical protein
VPSFCKSCPLCWVLGIRRACYVGRIAYQASPGAKYPT